MESNITKIEPPFLITVISFLLMLFLSPVLSIIVSVTGIYYSIKSKNMIYIVANVMVFITSIIIYITALLAA